MEWEKLKKITSEELDEAIMQELRPDLMNDPQKVEDILDGIEKVLKNSEHMETAVQMALTHLASERHNPKHLACGFRRTIGAFGIALAVLLDRRYRGAPAVDELERLFGLGNDTETNK